MALELRWSRLAVSDVRSIFTYIDQFQPSAARRVVSEIESRVTALATSPFIGRRGESLGGGREFVVSGTPYIVYYRVLTDRVEIVRVLHGARQWPSS